MVQKHVFICTSLALTCVITLKWNCVGCWHFNNNQVIVTIANMASIRCELMVFRLDCVIAKRPYYLRYVYPSVLLSVRMYHWGCHRTDFREISHWRLMKICWKCPNLVKIVQQFEALYMITYLIFFLLLPAKVILHKLAVFEWYDLRMSQ